jgi:hypothetical protein
MRRAGSSFVSAHEAQSVWVMQNARTERVESRINVSISLGPDFGGLSFVCDDVSHEVAQLQVNHGEGSATEYVHLGTDKVADLRNPFRCSWMEA